MNANRVGVFTVLHILSLGQLFLGNPMKFPTKSNLEISQDGWERQIISECWLDSAADSAPSPSEVVEVHELSSTNIQLIQSGKDILIDVKAVYPDSFFWEISTKPNSRRIVVTVQAESIMGSAIWTLQSERTLAKIQKWWQALGKHLPAVQFEVYFPGGPQTNRITGGPAISIL